MCLGVFHLGFILFGTLWVSWTWVAISFLILGTFSTIISSIFSWPFLPGASTGDPTHDKVMWKRPDEQGRSGLEGPPGPAQASTPKPTILWLSPTLLILTGGYPRPPFSGENQLRALVDKSLGHERNISIQTPLLAF